MAWLQRALKGAAISAGLWLLLAGAGTPAARMRACADASRCTAGADAAAGAQVTSVMRQAARRAVAAAGPRLVEAMLLCEVAAAAEALAGAPRQSRVGLG